MATEYRATGNQLITAGAVTLAFSLGVGGCFLTTGVGVLFPIVGSSIGLYYLGKGLKLKLGAAAFTSTSLNVASAVPMGGVAHVRILLNPKHAVEVTSARLTFFTEEKAIYEAGTNSRTYKQEVHTWSVPVEVPPNLREPFHHAVRIPIPRDLPPTFRGSKNSLRSYCRLDLQIARWPDLELFEEVEVLPEVTGG